MGSERFTPGMILRAQMTSRNHVVKALFVASWFWVMFLMDPLSERVSDVDREALVPQDDKYTVRLREGDTVQPWIVFSLKSGCQLDCR